MADDQQNQSSGGSPWEEVLEEPDEPKKPVIFGSLEKNQTPAPATAKSAQFSVPESMPSGVGAKQAVSQIKEERPAPTVNDQPIVEKPSTPPVAPTAKIQNPPPSTSEAPQPVVENKNEKANIPPISLSPPPKTGIKNRLSGIFHRRPAENQAIAKPPVSSLQQPTVLPPVVPTPPAVAPIPKPQAPVYPAQPSRPIAPSSTINQPAKPIVEPTAPKAPPVPKPDFLKQGKKSFFDILFQPKLLIVEIIIVLLVGLTYFNETGLISTGVEKVYGIFHLEAIWGGLPADPQMALAKSLGKMSTSSSFNLDSEMKLTINKNSDSKITKPLFARGDQIILFALDKARLAASDNLYNDFYSTDSSTSGDALSQTPPADSSTSTADSQTDQSATSTPATTIPQDSQTVETTTSDQTSDSSVKEYSLKANSYFGNDGASAKLEINSESGKQSNIDLMEKASKLYIKSSNVDYSGSDKDWVFAKLASNSEALPAVFKSPNLTGVSVTGSRLGSGKVNNIPVYRYQVNIKIGSLFENLGIKDEMIDSITGEIDIGKKDQFIHYLDLIITPAVSSSVTRIDLKAALSNFGNSQDISIPAIATEISSGTAVATTTETTTPSTTITPTTSNVSADLLARDAQRKTDLRKIETALGQYHQANNKYPSTADKTIQTRAKGNILSTKLVPKYLAVMPVDPWSDKYYYGYKSDGLSYELTAVLGNNQDVDGIMMGGKNLFIIKH